jgi:hypothetical protein
VLGAKYALQVCGQVIPAGLLETVPAPFPPRATVSVGKALKVAVTCWLAFIVTSHVEPVPLQPPPLQPAKVELVAGVAVSLTCVPRLKGALQVDPQLIPGGILVTVPFPARLTINTGALAAAKFAVTFWLALSVNTHVELVLRHAPVHPTKDELVPAVAVRVTAVLSPKLALQVCPQVMPEGLLLTLPWPEPPRVTVSTGEALKVAITEVVCVNVT